MAASTTVASSGRPRLAQAIVERGRVSCGRRPSEAGRPRSPESVRSSGPRTCGSARQGDGARPAVSGLADLDRNGHRDLLARPPPEGEVPELQAGEADDPALEAGARALGERPPAIGHRDHCRAALDLRRAADGDAAHERGCAVSRRLGDLGRDVDRRRRLGRRAGLEGRPGLLDVRRPAVVEIDEERGALPTEADSQVGLDVERFRLTAAEARDVRRPGTGLQVGGLLGPERLAEGIKQSLRQITPIVNDQGHAEGAPRSEASITLPSASGSRIWRGEMESESANFQALL